MEKEILESLGRIETYLLAVCKKMDILCTRVGASVYTITLADPVITFPGVEDSLSANGRIDELSSLKWWKEDAEESGAGSGGQVD